MSAYRFEQTTLQMVQRLPSMIRDHGLHAIEAELAIGGVEDLGETVRQDDEQIAGGIWRFSRYVFRIRNIASGN